MSHKDTITAGFNKSLLRKLKRELKDAAKTETNKAPSNIELAEKRRRIEDMADNKALADELGVNVMELGNEQNNRVKKELEAAENRWVDDHNKGGLEWDNVQRIRPSCSNFQMWSMMVTWI